MKFLSTWLRNDFVLDAISIFCNTSMKFLSTWLRNLVVKRLRMIVAHLTEVPEHMAKEFGLPRCGHDWNRHLNEVPEHMAQESLVLVTLT